MELAGPWRASICDDDLRRSATGMDAADDGDGWHDIEVPGHWRTTEAFASSDGPLLYRRRVDRPDDAPTDRPETGPGGSGAPGPGDRHWLVLDGLFYQGDVWFDGAYQGDTEGYFVPHAFDVTTAWRSGREHVVAVEATCSSARDGSAGRAITGIFTHGTGIDPDWNPGGLWRPVHIDRTGPVRINRLRVTCREADPTREVASLIVWADLDSPEALNVVVRTTVGDHTEHTVEQPLAAGANELSWIVVVDQPRLWWPWSLGDQPLETVTVGVWVEGADPDAAPSHERRVRTGLRTVSLDDWVLSVNGERLFLKGANLGPTRAALADATVDELVRDVSLAREAGLDLIRVHAHITREELYVRADEAGMLVWQDFPLQHAYARGVRKQAVRQAAHAVDLLGHHPSIALWCAHDEPFRTGIEPGRPLGARGTVRYALGQQLPTWNRTILDRSVKRSFEKADETRPVIAHSGVAPHLPQLDGTDSHLWFGWYHGDERDLPGFAATVPRMVRFVSEFGAQAVPESAAFMDPAAWPDLDWDRLARHHSLQQWAFAKHVPPERYATFDEWRAATQAYQAEVVRHQVEALRRLKYRPTGGFCVSTLTDAHPAVSAALLDHERVAKAGFHALTEACRPVIVVADRMAASVRPGDALALEVHVVNDGRQPLEGATVTGRLSWRGGGHSWRWLGDVDADGCARVGMVRFVVPDAPGALALDLDLTHAEGVASNRYTARIVRTR